MFNYDHSHTIGVCTSTVISYHPWPLTKLNQKRVAAFYTVVNSSLISESVKKEKVDRKTSPRSHSVSMTKTSKKEEEKNLRIIFKLQTARLPLEITCNTSVQPPPHLSQPVPYWFSSPTTGSLLFPCLLNWAALFLLIVAHFGKENRKVDKL